MDNAKLPAAYGKTRLVLLVVDPYLIHAYWEVASEKIRKVAAEQNKGVLRFYKGSETASEDALQDSQDSFDIEVDLQSRSWYVHLWSPEESLFADLAVKRNDGTLIPLVRSQVVHMPRARPAIAIDQRFMKVVATERRAEIVPAPPLPVEHRLPQEGMAVLPNELYASPVVKPIDCAQIVRETLKEMYFSVRWRVSEPGTAGAIATAPPGEADADLTAIAERNLAAGLPSSVLPKNPMKGEPDSKR